MSWRNDFDNTESRRKKDEPGSVLRNTVIGTIHFVSRNVVAKEGQCRKKVTEYPVSSQFTHIFHTDDIGLQLSNEATEMVQQTPFFIFFGFKSLGVLRERLARRASD